MNGGNEGKEECEYLQNLILKYCYISNVDLRVDKFYEWEEMGWIISIGKRREPSTHSKQNMYSYI